MIIDLILDRYHGMKYHAADFYFDTLEYENIFNLSHDITAAMDYSTNTEVQKALCNYIDENNYNAHLKSFINGVNWLADDTGKDYTCLFPLNNHVFDNSPEHIKNCFTCAAIAYEKQNKALKTAEEITKELYPDAFIKDIVNNTVNSIFAIIDSANAEKSL